MTAPIDRTRPPMAGPVGELRFPEFEHARLDNGLELYLARWPHYPLVSLDLLFPAGGQYNPPGRAGLTTIHGALLDEGTERLSALEIAASMEQMGGFLVTGADWDVAYVGVSLLASQLDAGLDLMADLARRPCFPDEEVKRLKRHRLADLLHRKRQPAYLAEVHMARAIFEGTVYAEPLLGTPESVEELERRDFVDFYERHMGPDGSALLAVGDFEPADLARRAEELFGDWSVAERVERPRIEPAPIASRRVIIVDLPGAAQVELKMGHQGISRAAPDFPAILLMNLIFGGKFTSHLNLILREERGITYGVHSRYTYRQERGPFSVKMAVATESAGLAAREVLAEMRRMREDLVSAEELAETCDYAVGNFPSTIQTVSDVSKRLETLTTFALEDDYFTRYPAELYDVSREEIREAARRHLHPDHLAVVAVGPAESLRPQLEALGPVEVVEP